MRQKYCQCLDFDKFRQGLAKVRKDEYPINDLESIPHEGYVFFQKLIEAKSTKELDGYSDEVLEENGKLLSESVNILRALSSYLDDDTILSDPNHLAGKMQDYRLKTKRRLL